MLVIAGLFAIIALPLSTSIELETLGIDEVIKRANVHGSNNKQYSPNGDIKVELDILLTRAQWQRLAQLRQEEKNNSTRAKRKAIMPLYYRWTNGIIPYSFQQNAYSISSLKLIESVMAQYEKYTCLKFRPRQQTDRNYVYIAQGGGCSSYVGMIGNAQVLSLAPGCLYFKVIAHELGHAIGLMHEQVRPDRDGYVKIMEENILDGLSYNFNKHPLNSVNYYGITYDYLSVMHYSSHAFSKNGLRTVITLDPDYQYIIGRVTKFSFKDLHFVNRMYSCAGKSSAQPCQTACPVGAYTDKYCVCQCPGDPVKPCFKTDKTSTPSTPKPTATTSTTTLQTTRAPDTCDDRAKYCKEWVANDHCFGEFWKYMSVVCRKSCDLCPDSPCIDLHPAPYCTNYTADGLCNKDKHYMSVFCRKTCGYCTPVICDNKNVYCDYWAREGYCSSYSSYMSANCRKSCQYCTS